MVRELIMSEFSGTREKIFETEGIKNINKLQKYAESRGFTFSTHNIDNYRYIELIKGTVSITVPISVDLPETELTMSIIIGLIRKKLTMAKH